MIERMCERQAPSTRRIIALTLLSARFSVHYFVDYDINGKSLYLKNDSECSLVYIDVYYLVEIALKYLDH